MTEAMDRVIVNAAIEKLITRTDDDGEAAKVVIAYGSNLNGPAHFNFEFSSHTTTDGGEVTGHSPGYGNISIKDKEREKHIEKTIGFTKERIGYYRLWKEQDGVLLFHHFWKSSRSTQPNKSERPDEYVLGYDEKTLKLRYLGIKRERVLTSFGFGIKFQTFQDYLEEIYGTVPKPSGRGFRITIGKW